MQDKTLIRKIIHIDMDAFYASVEQLDNPDLRGKAIVVGYEQGRGVISAASYEARKYGVHSAMPAMKARKLCPEIIFVAARMERYKEISKEIHKIFHEYTDIIEPIALDEAFLDVTLNKKNINIATDIAKEIKTEIKSRLGLIASAGVSYNKMLAKIASDYNKPDGLYLIHPQKALEFIDTLRIESIWGIGKVTGAKMHSLGIHTGKQLRRHSMEFLTRNFGKSGKLFYDFARGIDTRNVEAYRERKSVGCEFTFEKDLNSKTDLIIKLWHINQDLKTRLKKSQFHGKTLTLKIKFKDFTQITRSISVEHSLEHHKEILSLAKKLLNDIDLNNKSIRLMGLSISNPITIDKNSNISSTISGTTSGTQLKFDFEN